MSNNIKLPNLFIPGAAKSGTSSLHEILNLHPKISMSHKKEPYYWISDWFEDNTEKQKTDYLNLFDGSENIVYRGESSTSYMLFPKFIERTKKYNNQDIKFIFILRNPIDRIYSHYKYLKGLGSENLNLREAILKDKNIEPVPSLRLPEGKFKNYYQYGLYAKWLKRFYNNFESKNIKVLFFEDLIENRTETINDCFSFLGLQPISDIPEIKANPSIILNYQFLHKNLVALANGKKKLMIPINKLLPRSFKNLLKRNMSNIIVKLTKSNKKFDELTNEDREWIKNLYLEDVDKLKKMLNRDIPKWTDFKSI